MDSEMTASLHIRIGDALTRLAALARSRDNQEVTHEGLSPLQARALFVLQRRRGLRVGELAEELFVTYGTLSAAVSSLEEKGLLSKYVDPEEHRAVNLELTRSGLSAAQRIEDRSGDWLAAPIAEMDPQEAAGLLASLLALIRSFEREGAIAAARMCLTCRYFEAHGGRGRRPHFCTLLDEPIGSADLRVDCPDHDPVGAAQDSAS